jgi:hypothetical protein
VAWPIKQLGAPDALRRLPDVPASRCATRLPGATIRAIKWAIINASWYKPVRGRIGPLPRPAISRILRRPIDQK